MMKQQILAKNNVHLLKIIEKEIEINGLNCDLNHIDVSIIEDMSQLFEFSEFNGDFSEWNTSNVQTMGGMFASSKFNKDISKWNVINLKSVNKIFKESKAPVPYWAKINNNEERIIAIENYKCKQFLNKNMNKSTLIQKSYKI